MGRRIEWVCGTCGSRGKGYGLYDFTGRSLGLGKGLRSFSLP
jgi:hypothetical protein